MVVAPPHEPSIRAQASAICLSLDTRPDSRTPGCWFNLEDFGRRNGLLLACLRASLKYSVDRRSLTFGDRADDIFCDHGRCVFRADPCHAGRLPDFFGPRCLSQRFAADGAKHPQEWTCGGRRRGLAAGIPLPSNDADARFVSAGEDALPDERPQTAVWALVSLAIVAVLTCATVVSLLARQMNINGAIEKQHMVQAAYQREAAVVAGIANDYSHWTDATVHLYGHLDRRWAEANMGGYIPTFVIDQAANTLYGADGDDKESRSLEALAPGMARNILAVVPKRNLLTAGAVTIPGIYRGDLAVFSAAAIVPGAHGGPAPNAPRYVILVRKIGRPELAEWETGLGLSNVRLSSQPMGKANELVIRDRAGAMLRVIVWDEGQPGQKALVSLLPLLGVATAVFALLAGLLSRSIIATQSILRDQTRRADMHVEKLLAAQAAAESALADATAAKAESDRLSVAQLEEEERHARHLKHQAILVADRLQLSVGEVANTLLAKADALEESARRTLSSVGRQEQDAVQARTRSRTASQAVSTITGRTDELLRASERIADKTGATRVAADVAGEESAAVQQANVRLQAQVKAISDITGLINGLAARTNLVALNSTIEAARAGEHGRGFAVVASEVKELANSTRHRTTEIDNLVDGVRTAAAVNDTLVETLHGFLQKLGQHVAETMDAVDEQQSAARAILDVSHMVGSDAEAAHVAMDGIVAGLATVSADAHATQRIGADVRDHVTSLSRELDQMVAQLRAA